MDDTFLQHPLRIVGVLAFFRIEIHAQYVGQREVGPDLAAFPQQSAASRGDERASRCDPLSDYVRLNGGKHFHLGQHQDFEFPEFVRLQAELGDAFHRPAGESHRFERAEHRASKILRPFLPRQLFTRRLAV